MNLNEFQRKAQQTGDYVIFERKDMLLNYYQDESRKTAVYPGKLQYPALGLAGEVFEFIEKAYNDTKELGDILWYVAAVAGDADLTLFDCAGVEEFSQLSDVAETWLERNLAKGAGMVLESVKKSQRDDDGVLTDSRRDTIREGLGIVLKVLGEFAIELDTTLEKVAQENIDKLTSRQERGTLQGSGDDR